MKHLQKAEE